MYDNYLHLLNIRKIFVVKHSNTWVNILFISKNIIDMVKLSGKYYLLTIQEIIKSHTGNKTKTILEMESEQQEIEASKLKYEMMQIITFIKE